MIGTDVAHALIEGALTEVRFQKAARHLRNQAEWDAFYAALPEAERDEIAEKVKRHIPWMQEG